MGMMRKLLMGGTSGERTLVSTTTATTRPSSMPAMVMKVGTSYSVSWAGTTPSVSYTTVYLFDILGGYSNLSGMCYAKLEKSGAKRNLSIALLGTSLYSATVSVGDSIALELRFKVNTVSSSSPYYTMDVELYVNGTQAVSGTRPGTTDAGDGLRYYRNAAGTFIVKKLS